MTKTFTTNDLIRYIYNETNEQECRQISTALLCDSDLQETYKSLKILMKTLDKITAYPSKDCIDRIISYSGDTSLQSV